MVPHVCYLVDQLCFISKKISLYTHELSCVVSVKEISYSHNLLQILASLYKILIYIYYIHTVFIINIVFHMLKSINPYTGETNATFETLTDAQITIVIEQAHETYLTRRDTWNSEKKALFLKMADLLDERNEEMARLETIEMGMLYHASKKWLRSTANLIRRNANNFEEILWNEIVNSDWLEWHIQYDALGVIYGIAPWNFPFNQLLRAAVPNIIAWNTVIYKHASNVPMCLEAIEKLFTDAWFPTWVFTKLFISSSKSEQIIAHPYIKWVNLTGSEEAWKTIWSLAGTYIKPSILELWWNDAFVLLDHDDMDAMVASATACRISYGGQKCNSSKRFIILEKHYDEFVEKFGVYMASQTVGDPLEVSTQVPPLSSNKLMKEIHSQVERTVAEWATLVTWWKIINEARNLYAPTVLADVTLDMTSAREEVFWPVATVIKSKNIEESIRLANDSEFGLSATVRGDDIQQCKEVAARLEWGMIFINAPAWSKASLPFWWVKKSGYGKENGPDGLKAFTNRKVVLY